MTEPVEHRVLVRVGFDLSVASGQVGVSRIHIHESKSVEFFDKRAGKWYEIVVRQI